MTGALQPLYVNGRFLHQPLSGVQRFALEITAALGRIWPGPTPVLLVPRGARVEGAPIGTRTVGTRQGAAWEQLDLPRHAADGFLLNLGNTAPLLVKRQAVVIHDTGAFSTPEAYSPAFLMYYRFLHRLLVRTNTRILTVSEASRQDILHHLGTPRHEIGLISEGADHLDRITAEPAALNRHALEPGKFVLAVGNLAAHKNLSSLTELAQRLERRRIPLVVTGQVDTKVFNTKHTSLPEPARYVGRVNDGELKALYQTAACFVSPSRYEGFGLPAAEAMACGCPVVVSAIPALKEICGNAAVFVDPLSPGNIAQGVERLLDDPALHERLRHDGLLQAANFTWQKAATALVASLLPAFSDTAPRASAAA